MFVYSHSLDESGCAYICHGSCLPHIWNRLVAGYHPYITRKIPISGHIPIQFQKSDIVQLIAFEDFAAV
jgi:hypothetical protein